MESLGKIFGSNNRVKIMRLFLFNAEAVFDIDDIALRSLIKLDQARKEINLLVKIGFLKKKSFSKKIPKKATKKNQNPGFKRVQKKGWTLNRSFKLVNPLHTLLTDSELINEKEMLKKFKKTGTIKLIVLSGLFMRDEDRKLDILVVGDKIKRNLLVKEITKLESEIGCELAYAIFDTNEFKYRMSMYDKLVLDVINNEHRFLINKIIH